MSKNEPAEGGPSGGRVAKLGPKQAARALDSHSAFYHGQVETLLKGLPKDAKIDLTITSPPYNIGKEYETKSSLSDYIAWQEKIIKAISDRMSPHGSICWQVGNYIDNGSIVPLDVELLPIFYKLGYKLRNRIVWHFGHGLHNARRFSGRYEVILWMTKSDEYVFNLDDVRVPAKYPGKRAYKGPNAGKLSGNPGGKNPEDVWNIPNVKANHVEKTVHPCQFPVALAERLVRALSSDGGLVFDPFAGVATTGVAALLHGRRFIGAEPVDAYFEEGFRRLQGAIDGSVLFRPDVPVYDHTLSPLSRVPSA